MFSHVVTQTGATIDSEMSQPTRRNVPKLPPAWKARLKAAWEAEELSQNAAAKAAGTTGASVHRLMNDRGSWDTAGLMSKRFKVPLPEMRVRDDDGLVRQMHDLARDLVDAGAQDYLAELVDAASSRRASIEKLAKARGPK